MSVIISRQTKFAGRTVPLIFSLALCAPVWSQSSPSAYTTGYRYDAARRVVGVILPDPDGAGPIKYAATRNTYDSRGVLTSVETGELSGWKSELETPATWSGFTVFRRTDYTYDVNGRPLSELVSSGAGVAFLLKQYSYDPVGRVQCTVRRMNPAAFNTAMNACSLGTEGSNGPDRIEKVELYDDSDRPRWIIRGYGTANQQNYASYTYVGAHRASSSDANGNKSTFEVDGFGRLEYWRFPSPTTAGQTSTTDFEKYSYDANGNRTQVQKRDGALLNFHYDALNRMDSKDVPGTAQDATYTYDLRNLPLTAMFSATATGLTNSYDGFGRIKDSRTTVGGANRLITYLYDENGNRTRITHPDNSFFGYGYDGLNRMTHICENPSAACNASTSPIVTATYNPQGRRSQLSRGASGSVTDYGYDPITRLTSISHNLDGAGTTNDYGLSFTSINASNQVLTRVLSNSTYEFSQSQPSRTYSVNGLNQYTQIASPAVVTPMYDPNGNLTNDGATAFTYDSENRLTVASGAKNANLAYDPNGRLYQVTGTGTTQFLYDGGRLIAEYSSGGTLLRRYVHGTNVDEPMVWYEGSTVTPSNRRYFHADYLGSIVAFSSNNGTTLEKETYDPYGIQGSANNSRFQYTGQTFIPEVGLYYYKARFYSPFLGRFLQTDPVGYKDDLNLYAYARNDPVNKIDPSGSTCVPITSDTGQITAVASCKIDIDRNKAVQKYGEAAVAQLENSYKNAVNKLLHSPKYSSTTFSVRRTDGKGNVSATASASTAASSLIKREITYDPTEDDAMSTSRDGTKGAVGDKAFDEGDSLTGLGLFRNPQSAQTRAWVHEGIHTPDVHRQLGPDRLWYDNHLVPFQDAADDLLEKSE